MAFDLSSVISQATEVVNQSQSDSGDGKRPRIIYPGPGTLKVKLLYNPKSSTVTRLIKRHKIGNTNYVCLSMYGYDCPICKAVENINNATGSDIWKFNAKSRGISYAQYISSQGYSWDDDNKEPQQGELILLMYPWTIYQDINRIISTAGVNASQLIAENEGPVVNITRWIENTQVKYKADVEPFNPKSYKSFPTDAEFESFLNDTPNLNESIVPVEMTDEVRKASNDAAETLQRDYLGNVTYGSIPTSQSSSPVSLSGSSNQIITDSNGIQYQLINGQYVPISNVQQQPIINNQMMNPQMMTPQVNQMINPVMSTPQNQVMNQQSQQPMMANQMMSNSGVQNAPVNAQPSNPAGSVADGSSPECFGSYQEGNPKCLACLNELQCMTLSMTK